MFLEKINNPNDLKKLSSRELPNLCSEIRELIVDTVSKNGGHLAPSLGVVELTTALHYVFDSPNDKVVWDVGHQSYAHKILTGRRDRFHTLRTANGISGFPKISESEHDAFGTGHSSTSISAALGIAHAMKRQNKDNRAIAVIGDGAMTGGLAFEAMNNAGHKVGNLIVVLNDNEMSISPNVGALSKFFSINVHGKTASRLNKRLKRLLFRIPFWGTVIFNLVQRAKETTVSFFTPGFLFEAFGFDYMGPIDGHNIDELIRIFNEVKSMSIGERPILIHVMTKKGKGYKLAEDNPTKFHGIGSFNITTGETHSSSGRTFTDAFGDAIVDLADRDPKIVAITAAMTTGTGLTKFAKKYPDRFFDVGIAEGHAVTFAAGLATQGYKPVVAIYSTFLQRAYDQIIHDVCLQNLPVIFAIDRAGVVGEDGSTHHGLFDISFLNPIPNMTIAAPRDEQTLREMLFMASKYNGPMAIRYPRGEVPALQYQRLPKTLEYGKAQIVYEKEKPQTTVWAAGHLVIEAVKAANILSEEGIDITVIDPCFVKPFDFSLFNQLSKHCSNVITVEEGSLTGGLGSLIKNHISDKDLSIYELGISDEFTIHTSQNDLRRMHNIDSSAIAEAVRGLDRANTIHTFASEEDSRGKTVNF
ncbi:MAG: 1-deoxy-D-xylulose-5-phosphate synthase [Pseudomonadota bacterium]